MPTPRKPTAPTAEAIDQFCAAFDPLFPRREEREAFRHYLIGLLLPREHNKTVVELAALVPGANRQQLHHFMHDAPWEAEAVNRQRLQLWRTHPYLGPHAAGVLILDETGDPKRGHRIALAAQQYLGTLGHVANGVVAVTSQWTDGTRHVPVGVKLYRPASRLPKGKTDPAFHTKPDLAWTLIQEARAAKIPFRLVVADSVYGENALLESRLFAAHIPYVMGLRPSHGTWQWVPDPKHPPAFTPAEAAQRLPRRAWQRTVRRDESRQGTGALHRSRWSWGTSMGQLARVPLVAATLDPAKLDPKSTWYLTTSLPLSEASAEQVYELDRLRDWIEHSYKPAKHELGWADYQMRPERAILRHWHLVMLAFTFSLLMGSPPASQVLTTPAAPLIPAEAGGKKRRTGRRGTPDLGRDLAYGAPMALSLGPCAAILAALVECPSAA